MSLYNGPEVKMIGKVITAVEKESPERVTFRFQGGQYQSFTVSGDCCSTSWIEHLEVPNDVVGATIVSITEDDKITSDHDAHDEENGGDSIAVYNTRFRTDRGDIVLEYRNSSNGYYGGSLDAADGNL